MFFADTMKKLKLTLLFLMTLTLMISTLMLSPHQADAAYKKKWRSVGTFHSTAYTPYDPGSGGRTALGWNIRSSKKKVIAVDPRVIRLGSKVKVYYKGKYKGTYTAADTGGAIKGKRIDILMYSRSEAFKWGRKNVSLKVYK